MGDTARQRIPKSDTNYGVTTSNTIRTASQIGNATGPADFDTGLPTSQTLRVILAVGSSVGITSVSAGVNHYDEKLTVSAGATVVVTTFTATASFFLLRASGSGNSDAEMFVRVNGLVVGKKRNNWCDRNVDFDFGNNGIPVAIGEIIEFVVKNLGETISSFNGTIYGEEV